MLSCLYYTEAIVLNLWCLEKSWRSRKCQEGYCRLGQVLGRDKGFLVMTEVSGSESPLGSPTS